MEHNKLSDKIILYFPNKKTYLENFQIYLENILTSFKNCDNILIQSYFVEEKP